MLFNMNILKIVCNMLKPSEEYGEVHNNYTFMIDVCWQKCYKNTSSFVTGTAQMLEFVRVFLWNG